MGGCVLDKETRDEILDICKKTASASDIVGVSIYDLPTDSIGGKGKDINVLLILAAKKLTLKHQRKGLRTLEGSTVSLLAVDQRTFKEDVEKDWLGGLLVENMLVPYQPLVNADFLWDQEVKAKKRVVTEILGNLVLEYPEMISELLIRPEYFMFEAMARKASLYPPITYRFLSILRGDLGEKNRELMMIGFKAALDELAREELVDYSEGCVKIAKGFASAIQRRKLRVLHLLKGVRNRILRHSLVVFPEMMRYLIEDYGLYTRRFMDGVDVAEISLPELEDTKRFIFMPTSSGLVSLSDKVTIEDFVRRTVSEGAGLRVHTEKFGGVLNAVYRLSLHGEKESQTIIVKVFKDWYGWKWFPLALWALGTRGFAVLGKSRLEKEYAANRFLSSKGINVPRIIYVSPKERLIFQEYVEGENLTKVIKRICSSKEKAADLAGVVRQVGGEVAKAHQLDVALGDCKPENVIIAEDGRIFFVDLEQAARDGDQAWDIAELLYYSGHYALLSPVEVAQMMARELIDGYLEAGGKIENIRKARFPRYVKVFSFFTPPHILFAISNTCKEELRAAEAGM